MTEINCGPVRFVDIPEYFLERYAEEINAWAANVRAIGLLKSFVLKEGRLADASPNPEVGPVLVQVRLMCRPWRGGVEIRPATERDERMIRLHCEKLQTAGWPARLFDKELPRAGVPFMPDRVH